jgi:hypothetical protein
MSQNADSVVCRYCGAPIIRGTWAGLAWYHKSDLSIHCGGSLINPEAEPAQTDRSGVS